MQPLKVQELLPGIFRLFLCGLGAKNVVTKLELRVRLVKVGNTLSVLRQTLIPTVL